LLIENSLLAKEKLQKTLQSMCISSSSTINFQKCLAINYKFLYDLNISL
jgi:hypothetical protein